MFQNPSIHFGEKIAVYARYRSRLDRMAYNRTEVPDAGEVARIAKGLETVSHDMVVLTCRPNRLKEAGVPEESLFQRSSLAFDDDRNSPLPDIILTDEDATSFRTYYQALGNVKHLYAQQYAESFNTDPACRKIYLEAPKRPLLSETEIDNRLRSSTDGHPRQGKPEV